MILSIATQWGRVKKEMRQPKSMINQSIPGCNQNGRGMVNTDSGMVFCSMGVGDLISYNSNSGMILLFPGASGF
jgi:hypothetical protein